MRTLGAFVVAVALTVPALAANGYRVVANPSVKSTTLSKSALSDIFLKKTRKWDDGTNIVALDQIQQSAVRASFGTTVHGRSITAVKNYWNQQVFTGRDVPLVEKASDDEVLSFVRTTPGAVGYVSEGADVRGVKIIDIP